MTRLVNDRTLRSVVYLLIAALLAMTWGFSGVAKLLAGGVPEWFSKSFGSTVLASFPGLPVSFMSIAILETLAAVIALASILRGEFFRSVRPGLLYTSVVLSLALFVQLSFGKQLVMDFAGSHDLFMYFAGSLIILMVVRALDSDTTSNRL
jgi:hypothetical protein